VPFALATIAEHVGDMVALSSITGEDFVEKPGLARTLIGDGVASMFSGLIGGPASTTYGENVGVVALTKVFNPRVVQIAAIFAVILGFSPLFEVIIRTIPDAIIGGASFMLYGMIAAVGIRNLVEARIDMAKTKNLTIIAVMLVTGLGMRFAAPIFLTIGDLQVPMARMGLAIAVVLGIILNAILPDEDKKKRPSNPS
ncbi:MAG: uracil-xanthine permease, partial [Defluviitaleaceae bacterium]|nr:uracil-xanthine permease [Defluviitaleaceae bacterium]